MGKSISIDPDLKSKDTISRTVQLLAVSWKNAWDIV